MNRSGCSGTRKLTWPSVSVTPSARPMWDRTRFPMATSRLVSSNATHTSLTRRPFSTSRQITPIFASEHHPQRLDDRLEFYLESMEDLRADAPQIPPRVESWKMLPSFGRGGHGRRQSE